MGDVSQPKENVGIILLKIDGNLMGKVLTSPIRCVKANIKRDKNGELYLEYFGEVNLDSGDVAAIYIERLNLDIGMLKCCHCDNKDKYLSINNTCISVPFYTEEDSEIKIDYREKEMTKEEMEKELGYRIKIIG